MTNDPTTLRSRLRAALAATLASSAAGARRLEDWSSRRTRPLLIALVVGALVVVSLVGLFGVAVGGRHVAGWMRGDAEFGRSHRGPDSRFVGKPHGKPVGKPDGRREERQEARPALPPAPPAADAPPPPPPPGR